jgi:hypothetical protein
MNMCGSGIMHMEGVLLAEKSVNREKHEKDKMTEDSNTHGSEES